MLPQYRPPTHLIGAIVTVLLCSTATRICGQEIKCYHPAVPPNTRVTLSTPGLTPGTTAVYQCDEGYETFGNTTLVCSPTGQWQGEIPFCGINVAYRKPANQSTTAKGGNAIHANDGDKTTNHNEKMCTETYKEASPWWQVDLLRPYPVKVIRVTTRGCCGQQPLQDLEIRIGNNSHQLQKNPLCAWFPGTLEEGVTKTFTCARTLIGQYVFVQLGVEGTLSLCEVEVFSSDELPVHHCQSSKNLENAALATFAKKCYFFEVNKGSTFKTARSTCQSINSDLIHNLTTLDMSFLRAQLDRWKPKLKTQLVWLGANKDPGVIARTWKWVNGE
ncbi:unnamed protein product [Callosobruchus maculatus]|uniref:Sushi domain-containing protein n=1 Tax=Callosobruchus maculatus TaxID=64391 RepID=A0A653DDB8_CALMS|nr:unnamed protein product [Callosobruchus maculatus]